MGRRDAYRSPKRAHRHEAGISSITVLVAMVALLVMSALAIDAGMVWASRTQLQNAADAAALAAASNLIDPTVPASTLPAAQSAAVNQAAQNRAGTASSVTVLVTDLTFGDWDLATRTLDTSVNLSDPNELTAVQVQARLDGVANGPVPATLSRVMGRTGFSVGASATGYLGYAGRVGPGEVDLPIAIDCCKLKGPGCSQDYCPTITANPVNPCPLTNPQSQGATTVSCLEFSPTGNQNACWTNFDDQSPSINTSDLRQVVQSGNSFEIDTSDPIFVDNGTKTPVISEIEARFLGQGAYSGNPSGVDRYAPIHTPPQPDSWVVGLPVVECQDSLQCATGSPSKVVGVVCFELREIAGAPDKILRGRFLCPSDPLYQECDVGTTVSGGLDFGLRADVPVLVR